MASSKEKRVTLGYGGDANHANPSLKIYSNWFMTKLHETTTLYPWENVFSVLKLQFPDEKVVDFLSETLKTEGVEYVIFSKDQITIYKFRATEWSEVIDNIVAAILTHLTEEIVYTE